MIVFRFLAARDETCCCDTAIESAALELRYANNDTISGLIFQGHRIVILLGSLVPETHRHEKPSHSSSTVRALNDRFRQYRMSQTFHRGNNPIVWTRVTTRNRRVTYAFIASKDAPFLR